MSLSWQALQAQCQDCHNCRLCQRRHNAVFGIGPKNAEILFVGEGPGEQEDLQGQPFVGPAGQLLDEMLSIIDLGRHNCYITNVVKCRPPGNRDPQEDELAACQSYLAGQMALLQPQILICLGRIAAKALIHPDYRITREHGQWVEKEGIWYTAIYHPSALLRDPSKRPDAFRDLLSIREKVQSLCRNHYDAFGPYTPE